MDLALEVPKELLLREHTCGGINFLLCPWQHFYIKQAPRTKEFNPCHIMGPYNIFYSYHSCPPLPQPHQR